ncbi:hypothetical protein PVAND_009915 [Polypedilum vanderplanki]|uniref:Uncharacterized protein n=1 Tax=Polypedilum vanderplanki TaxID=319348 RepID=A0A9J6CFL9_POLVA|nr:hypothetical protein PVAND_009915 [Polypedilum vanderplanki]
MRENFCSRWLADCANHNSITQTNGNEYQCNVQNKEVFNGNRVTIEKAEGNQQSGKSDDDVKFFLFNWCKFEIFSKKSREDLKPFPKLKYLQLQGNPIEVIREDLFINNPELEVLYLENNEINHIDPKALSH